MWMNEYDIEEALRLTAHFELPNKRRAAEVLDRLKDWTNRNSDGWPYWQKPARAANKLMELIDLTAVRRTSEDCTEAELRRALVPIKAFLTRQHVDHVEVGL